MSDEKSRREFLFKLGTGAGVVALTAQGAASLRSLVPNVSYDAPTTVKLGQPAEFPDGDRRGDATADPFARVDRDWSAGRHDLQVRLFRHARTVGEVSDGLKEGEMPFLMRLAGTPRWARLRSR